MELLYLTGICSPLAVNSPADAEKTSHRESTIPALITLVEARQDFVVKCARLRRSFYFQ
jgi:hypothetical protein